MLKFTPGINARRGAASALELIAIDRVWFLQTLETCGLSLFDLANHLRQTPAEIDLLLAGDRVLTPLETVLIAALFHLPEDEIRRRAGVIDPPPNPTRIPRRRRGQFPSRESLMQYYKTELEKVHRKTISKPEGST